MMDSITAMLMIALRWIYVELFFDCLSFPVQSVHSMFVEVVWRIESQIVNHLSAIFTILESMNEFDSMLLRSTSNLQRAFQITCQLRQPYKPLSHRVHRRRSEPQKYP